MTSSPPMLLAPRRTQSGNSSAAAFCQKKLALLISGRTTIATANIVEVAGEGSGNRDSGPMPSSIGVLARKM